MIALALCLLVALACATPALAAATAESGDRVRATLIERPNPRVKGTLLSYRPESITVAAEPDSAESTIARPSIKRLETSEGMRSNAGKGAVIGALVGLVAMGAVASGVDTYDSPGAALIPIYLGLGVLVGGGVGAAIGSASQHEHWERVRIPK